MQARRLGAKLQHVAEHGNAPAAPAGPGLAEQRKGGAHRGGVGIVALVDHRDGTVGRIEPEAHAAPLLRLQMCQRHGGPGEVASGESGLPPEPQGCS
jgi:hypothetical protein